MDPDSEPTALFSEPPEHAFTFNHSTETAGQATQVWPADTLTPAVSPRAACVTPTPSAPCFPAVSQTGRPFSILGGQERGAQHLPGRPHPAACSGALGPASQAVLGSSLALLPKC